MWPTSNFFRRFYHQPESDNATESSSEVDGSPVATDSDTDSRLLDAAWEISVTVIGATITATAALVGGFLWRKRCTQVGKVNGRKLGNLVVNGIFVTFISSFHKSLHSETKIPVE